ncbi:exonuclease [Staphylococcus phage vB_SauH_DELF3]|nr:exonuclease [Staphylococcus phage vB_SauH_DELF3]
MVKFDPVGMNYFLDGVHIKLSLAPQGVVLIEGFNKTNDSIKSYGTRKTEMIYSSAYALFGGTEKILKKDDVDNRYKKKDTYIMLSRNIGTDVCIIELCPVQKANKNKGKLLFKAEEITGSTNDLTDQQIQDFSKIYYNTYLNDLMYE